MALQGKVFDGSIDNDSPVSRRHKMDRDRIERLRSENWVPLKDSGVRLEPVAVSAAVDSAAKILIGAVVGLTVGYLVFRR